MAPMTETPAADPMSAVGFYDSLAAEYDLMTAFERRFVRERPFFRLLVERFGIRTAIDAGSGTGFLSILLAQLGVKVMAVDSSEEMLQRVREHAVTTGVSITTVCASFEELPQRIASTYDAVFCLGNSLAHVLDPASLRLVIGNFHDMLNPGGILFLQFLNYERILAERPRILGAKEAGGVTWIRFYDYEEDQIRFNILRLEGKGGDIEQHLQSTLLRPVRMAELVKVLHDAGFSGERLFGSIAMDEFHTASSNDLVVLATKPGVRNG